MSIHLIVVVKWFQIHCAALWYKQSHSLSKFLVLHYIHGHPYLMIQIFTRNMHAHCKLCDKYTRILSWHLTLHNPLCEQHFVCMLHIMHAECKNWAHIAMYDAPLANRYTPILQNTCLTTNDTCTYHKISAYSSCCWTYT